MTSDKIRAYFVLVCVCVCVCMCVFVCVCVYVCMYMCVYVCVRERERERESLSTWFATLSVSPLGTFESQLCKTNLPNVAVD